MSQEVFRRENSSNKLKDQKGYSILIVIVLIFILFGLVVVGMTSAMRTDRSTENLAVKQKEKWAAKSALNVVKRIVEVRLPERYQADLMTAQNCLERNERPLPAFDGQDLPAENSVPVLVTEANGESYCNRTSGINAEPFTSMLGNSNNWSSNRVPIWLAEANGFGYDSSQINVARISEIVRRYNNVGEPLYQFGFILDARGGLHYRVREQGEVSVGAVSQNCGATGRLEISPRSVQQGTPVTFRITYTNVNLLRILDQSNTVIHQANVDENGDPKIYEWTYTPTATGQYRVEALSSAAGCFSRSEWIQVEVTTVPPPPCPIIDSLTATPDTVLSGESSTIAWATRNASEVTLDGTIVAANGSQPFTMLADRTFTLIARDAANNCSATRQVTVRVTFPPCPTPVVTQFTVTPSTATPGQAVAISWQIDNLMAGGVVNITMPDGTVLSNVGASGTRNINAPGSIGNYNYAISATNPCGTSANGAAQLIVQNSCQIPSIGAFVATPSSVVQGGTETVRLQWILSGSVDSMNISGIGNVTGNSIDIPQPQTTTDYLLTVNGCGIPVTRSVTVTVSPITTGDSCNFNMPSEFICSVVSTNQCGPHSVAGNITVSGNNFTLEQQHTPFASNGLGYLNNVAFNLFDSSNRQILFGSWSYTESGVVYWNSRPSGAGTLSSNGVTVSGIIPAGYSTPLYATFNVSYGANAGFDTRGFDTRSSPGGCATTGGGTCSNTQETEYFCDQNSNGRFTVNTIATVSGVGNNQYDVTIPTPAVNYFQSYSSGTYIITTSDGSREYNWTAIPGRPNSLPLGTNETTVRVTSTSSVTVIGNYEHFVSTSGECTVGGSLSIFVGFSASSCAERNRR